MDKEHFVELLRKYDFVRLVTPDLNGIHLSKLLHTRHAEKIANNECDIYTGLVAFGFRTEVIDLDEMIQHKFCNGPMKVDPLTLRPLPWASDEKTLIAECVFESLWPDGTEVGAHPRVVARRQLEKLEQMGYSLYSAFEPEFRVFHKEAPHEPITWSIDLYRTGNLVKFEKLFTTMERMFHTANIDVQDYSVENGASQLETPLRPKIGIEAADMAFSFRQAVKEIADKEGFMVSHMSKPLPKQSANGWHFNHSLLDHTTGKPVMFDETSENNMSEVMVHWLGGIMEHLAALTALTSPTVNCYRRLHRGLAPDLVNWDLNDRFKAVRVKNVGPKGTYVELRTPSSAASPYHVLAGTVAAGMDGIRRKLKPPPPGRMDAKPLPTTLEEALVALEKDVIICEALGAQFIDWYGRVKRGGCLKVMKDVDLSRDDEEALQKERERYFEYC